MSHPIKHFRTITRHRHAVIRHCAKAGILWQGLCHDISKYSAIEFLQGAKFYDGSKSPNENERTVNGYSKAWMHHKGRNRHHFEYWTDYNPVKRKIEPVKMPLKYVAEMFCDRVAAGKIYKKDKFTINDPLDYFERGKANRFIHPQTSDLLESFLVMLKEKGEDETFEYIKSLVKNKKEY